MLGLYDIWFQLVCEKEFYSDPWLMVLLVANIPGLVHLVRQPCGLKKFGSPTNSSNEFQMIG